MPPKRRSALRQKSPFGALAEVPTPPPADEVAGSSKLSYDELMAKNDFLQTELTELSAHIKDYISRTSSVLSILPTQPMLLTSLPARGPLKHIVQKFLSRPLYDIPEGASDAFSWSVGLDRVLLAFTDSIGSSTADTFPGDCTEPALLYASLRRSLLSCVNQVDGMIARSSLLVRRPCPDSCPAPDLRLAMAVDPPAPPACVEQSTQTDPPPSPPAPPLYAEQSAQSDPLPSPIPTPSALPSDPVLGPTGPSSAHVASRAPKDPGPWSRPPKHKPKAPAPPAPSVRDPIRFVANFGGMPPPSLFSTPHADLFHRLTLALSLHTHISGVRLLGAHWNKARNLVLAFPPGSPETALLSALPVLRSTLHLEPSTPLSRITTWSKVMVSSVPAWEHVGSPTYLEDALHSKLLSRKLYNANKGGRQSEIRSSGRRGGGRQGVGTHNNVDVLDGRRIHGMKRASGNGEGAPYEDVLCRSTQWTKLVAVGTEKCEGGLVKWVYGCPRWVAMRCGFHAKQEGQRLGDGRCKNVLAWANLVGPECSYQTSSRRHGLRRAGVVRWCDTKGRGGSELVPSLLWDDGVALSVGHLNSTHCLWSHTRRQSASYSLLVEVHRWPAFANTQPPAKTHAQPTEHTLASPTPRTQSSCLNPVPSPSSPYCQPSTSIPMTHLTAHFAWLPTMVIFAYNYHTA
ncbi:hypothetical protein BDV93DRAFT_514839 [Ceratobasidium sp. AG-I]|nr:hypothetical protein BDV93DRAFT_514839 [Ceratobasidium sp. AG-I]